MNKYPNTLSHYNNKKFNINGKINLTIDNYNIRESIYYHLTGNNKLYGTINEWETS